MPTQTQHTNDEVKESARLALSAYNYFNVTDGEQGPLAGLAALRALFIARITSTPDEEEEKRKYIEDWDQAIQVVALIDTDVSGANTLAQSDRRALRGAAEGRRELLRRLTG